VLGNAMGDALNFLPILQHSNCWPCVGNVERKEARKLLLSPLPLFEFDPQIPIKENPCRK
jgi:hypothetical protein